jgi:hypothetical protein
MAPISRGPKKSLITLRNWSRDWETNGPAVKRNNCGCALQSSGNLCHGVLFFSALRWLPRIAFVPSFSQQTRSNGLRSLDWSPVICPTSA